MLTANVLLTRGAVVDLVECRVHVVAVPSCLVSEPHASASAPAQSNEMSRREFMTRTGRGADSEWSALPLTHPKGCELINMGTNSQREASLRKLASGLDLRGLSRSSVVIRFPSLFAGGKFP